MEKGQVSSEYMLILAVVLVIAIAAIALLRDTILTGGSVNQQQSRAYWSVASPFSITAHKYQGSMLELDVQSSLPVTVDLQTISVEGTNHTIDRTFNPGQRAVINVSLSANCGDAGNSYSLEDIQIRYVPTGSLPQTQSGSIPLVGTCS